MAQGRRERGKEEGERQGSQNLFLFALGCRRFPSSGAGSRSEEVSLFVLLRGCSRRLFLYWTRHGPPERRRREKKKKEIGEGKSTAHERRQPLEVGFLGEREEEPWREDRVLSPPPLFRESVLYASFGEQACLLQRPFFGLLAADGCGSGRPRLGRRERASRGRNSRSKKKRKRHSSCPLFILYTLRSSFSSSSSNTKRHARLRPSTSGCARRSVPLWRLR